MWLSEAEEVPSDAFYFPYENDDKFILSKFSAGLCVCACVCWWRAVLKKMEKAENNSGRSWEKDLRT